MSTLTGIFFLFGVLAGFAITRLSRRHGARGRERRVLRALGYLLMGASFALSAALFGLALWRQL